MRLRLRHVYSRRVGIVLTAVVLTVAISGEASGQGSPILRSKAVDADALLAKATGPGGVRVIVTLTAATGAQFPPGSSSTQQPASPAAPGPLNDGQVATVEQAQLLARHIGTEEAKRQRWSPRLIPNTPYVAVTVTKDELEALAADPDVVSIHEDGQLRPGLQDSVPLIGMNIVHTSGATGANTMVAVLDTGVEYGHVFTTPRVTNATCFSTSNASFATLCPNGMTSQIGGTSGINCGVGGCAHGTHVAGIAAGNQASGTPLNGVAKGATIFAGQVFSRRLSDNALIALDSDMLASLNDLLGRVSGGGELSSRNVAAINLSIWDVGFQVAGNCDASARGMPFKTVIDALRAANVATVIISGNNSQTNLSAFPGCVSSAVTVSSTTKADAVSSFSNMSSIVDLLAPGSSITSSINPTPGFGAMSGTSMAAPHVTGAFATVRSACPNATVGDIEALLKGTGASIIDTRAGGTLVKPRIRVNAAIQQCGFPRDFNGDGKADIVWREAAGTLAVWLMNGGLVAGSAILGNVATTWTIAGLGDFNGDGRADIVWRDTAGNVAVWLMNGFVVAGSGVVGNVPTAFKIERVGDFNGDGKADILWRDTSGNVVIWLMNGLGIAATSLIGNVATTWTIAGLADFNGDGKADILWRDTAGYVAIWLMNGFAIAGTSVLGPVATTWAIVGTGDFNGDGKADILWRDGPGTLSIWLMNGFAVAGSGLVGNVSTAWTIDKVGDFNGNGKADILWRHTSGDRAIWLMNGFAITSTHSLGNVATSWVTQVGNIP